MKKIVLTVILTVGALSLAHAQGYRPYVPYPSYNTAQSTPRYIRPQPQYYSPYARYGDYMAHREANATIRYEFGAGLPQLSGDPSDPDEAVGTSRATGVSGRTRLVPCRRQLRPSVILLESVIPQARVLAASYVGSGRQAQCRLPPSFVSLTPRPNQSLQRTATTLKTQLMVDS
jgi:hypothetical protein